MAYNRLCPVCQTYDHPVPGPCPREIKVKDADEAPVEEKAPEFWEVDLGAIEDPIEEEPAEAEEPKPKPKKKPVKKPAEDEAAE